MKHHDEIFAISSDRHLSPERDGIPLESLNSVKHRHKATPRLGKLTARSKRICGGRNVDPPVALSTDIGSVLAAITCFAARTSLSLPQTHRKILEEHASLGSWEQGTTSRARCSPLRSG